VLRKPLRVIRWIALGAGLAYFFDPQSGETRRRRAAETLRPLTSRLGGGNSPEPVPGFETLGEPHVVVDEIVVTDEVVTPSGV
jgi:hypothetical protein